VELALMTEPQLGGTYRQLLAAARAAEGLGLAAFARSDHFYDESHAPATEAFTTLAGLARETESIRLVVLVSPITFRHPAVLVRSAASLDEMSGGRFDLGLGTGWMELEHQAFGIPFPARRFALLEEALGYVRAAFAPPPNGFTGSSFRLDAHVEPVPKGLRIVVGGRGLVRTPALAGRYADEYNHFAAPPTELAEKIARVRAAAEAAGRRGADVSVSVMAPIVTGPTTSAYRSRLEAVATAIRTDPKTLEQRWRSRHVPIGSPEEVRATLEALAAVGVGRYYIQHFDLGDLSAVEETVSMLR
jgi:alkanesulfonate monooxygenase SsuD/methylene tetrahydromethanopterin reductase-like flavin-dependent oxidoreductase (luciferase family)